MVLSASLSPSEWRRKAVHAGVGLFALTLRWLDWKAASAIALAALLFNLFFLPHLARGIYRDPRKNRDTGIVSYAAMVLLLVLLFRGRYLPIAAAVWAMMAFGDPAAEIAGRSIGGPRLPWNPDKTWTGLLADWAVAGAAAVLVFRFVTARPLDPAPVAILTAGAALFAFLESVRSGVDDNLVAALPTALAVFQVGYRWSGFAPFSSDPATLLGAAAVNVVAALLTRRTGLVAASGAWAGGLVGFLVIAAGGWSAYAVLWAFFLAGTAATRWGYRRKAEQGVSQADRGRRGAAHVVANVGVPAALLILGVRPVACIAALAAALADTLGTEIGSLYGRRPFSLLRRSRLPPGTPGAVSSAGIFAGLAGAAFLGTIGFLAGIIPGSAIAVVAVAGLAGSLAESVAQDFCRERGMRLDHEFANAFNTLVGGLAALEIALSIEAHRLYLPVAGA